MGGRSARKTPDASSVKEGRRGACKHHPCRLHVPLYLCGELGDRGEPPLRPQPLQELHPDLLSVEVARPVEQVHLHRDRRPPEGRLGSDVGRRAPPGPSPPPARTAYTPEAGSSSPWVSTLAVGKPMPRPRPSPFTTTPSRSKGRPSSARAAPTRPSRMYSRTREEEATTPSTVTGSTICTTACAGQRRLGQRLHRACPLCSIGVVAPHDHRPDPGHVEELRLEVARRRAGEGQGEGQDHRHVEPGGFQQLELPRERA